MRKSLPTSIKLSVGKNAFLRPLLESRVVPKKTLIRCCGDRRIQRAAEAISAALAADNAVRQELRRLLTSVRGDGHGAVEEASLRKLLDLLRPLLEIVLPHSVEDDHADLAGIRRFFLEPQTAYTLEELAALWRISRSAVRDVFVDELEAWRVADSSASDAFRVLWEDAWRASISYKLFRPFAIERALGADFTQVLTESWRTVPLVIHMPRFMVDVFAFDRARSACNSTPSARIEHYLFDHFHEIHRMEFIAALNESEAREG